MEKLHKLSFLGVCRGAQPTLYSSCPSHEPSPRAGSLQSTAAERRYLYNLSPLRSFIASLHLSSPPESREEMLGFFLSFLFIFSNLKIEVELIYSVELVSVYSKMIQLYIHEYIVCIYSFSDSFLFQILPRY